MKNYRGIKMVHSSFEMSFQSLIWQFFGDEAENVLWVFLDSEGNAVKAESMDEFKKFRERNAGKVKPKGKIYLSSSEDGGKSWSKSRLVYRSPEGSVCECCKPSIT